MFVILLKSTSMNQGYPKIMIKPDINLFFKNILTNKSGRSMTYLLQNYVFTKTELKSLPMFVTISQLWKSENFWQRFTEKSKFTEGSPETSLLIHKFTGILSQDKISINFKIVYFYKKKYWKNVHGWINKKKKLVKTCCLNKVIVY
jgi:hypothetical protein